jgi:hypothetical protein
MIPTPRLYVLHFLNRMERSFLSMFRELVEVFILTCRRMVVYLLTIYNVFGKFYLARDKEKPV